MAMAAAFSSGDMAVLQSGLMIDRLVDLFYRTGKDHKVHRTKGKAHMDDQSVILAVDGAVATVTLNRPDKLNSFTAKMHARLRDALDQVADDPAIGALVITGAGRGFCAGQDLADPALGRSPTASISASRSSVTTTR